MTAGRVSFRAMSRGTFQKGLNTTVVISSLKIGVGLSSLPVTTRIWRATCPRSTAVRWKVGMLART
jgi:hypothetical protein